MPPCQPPGSRFGRFLDNQYSDIYGIGMHQAGDPHVRISELLWRTVKLRAVLLLVIISILAVVWSALLKGDKKAREIDLKYCKQLIEQANSQTPAIHLDEDQQCDPPRMARNSVEAQRISTQSYLTVMQTLDLSKPSEKESFDKLFKLYQSKNDMLAKYEEERADAYLFEIQLSSEYSSSSVALNGQTAAKLLPFVIVVLFAIEIQLGFQQSLYRRALGSLLGSTPLTSHRGQRLAEAQFFLHFARDETSSFWDVMVVPPETLLIGILFLTAVVLFFAVLRTFIDSLLELTDSTIYNYPSGLLLFSFALGLLVLNARAQYGREFRGPTESAADTGGVDRGLVSRLWPFIFVVMGFSTLAMPWMETEGGSSVLRGFQFLTKQKLINQFGDVKLYTLDPGIFFEVRIQVGIALLFLIVCALGSIRLHREPMKVRMAFTAAQRILAAVVLFLSINYLIYMAILQWGTDLADNPFLFSFFSQEKGMPMSVYDPSYGFWIFVGACWVLIGVTFFGRRPRCDT